MPPSLPELSRFELQCLRRLWSRGEASVRQVQQDLPEGPGYSTFRKIFERLEAKGAVVRVRLEDRAWIYRSTVSPSRMIRKEIRRLIDGLFDGHGGGLMAHLADMDAITLADLRACEESLRTTGRGQRARKTPAAEPTEPSPPTSRPNPAKPKRRTNPADAGKTRRESRHERDS
jgi:predicted transcriptional regulator